MNNNRLLLLIIILLIIRLVSAANLDTIKKMNDNEKYDFIRNLIATDKSILESLYQKQIKLNDIINNYRKKYKPYFTAEDVNRKIKKHIDRINGRDYVQKDKIEYITKTKYNYGCCGPTITGLLTGAALIYQGTTYWLAYTVGYINLNLLMYVYINSKKTKPEGCQKCWEFPPVKFYTDSEIVGTNPDADRYNEETRQMIINENLKINDYNQNTMKILKKKNAPIRRYNNIIDNKINSIIKNDLIPAKKAIGKYEHELNILEKKLSILKKKLGIHDVE